MDCINDEEVKLLYKLAARHAKYKVDWCNGWPDIWNAEQGMYEQWRPLICDDQSEELRRRLRIEISVTSCAVYGRRCKSNGDLIATMMLDANRDREIAQAKRLLIVKLAAAK